MFVSVIAMLFILMAMPWFSCCPSHVSESALANEQNSKRLL